MISPRSTSLKNGSTPHHVEDRVEHGQDQHAADRARHRPAAAQQQRPSEHHGGDRVEVVPRVVDEGAPGAEPRRRSAARRRRPSPSRARGPRPGWGPSAHPTVAPPRRYRPPRTCGSRAGSGAGRRRQPPQRAIITAVDSGMIAIRVYPKPLERSRHVTRRSLVAGVEVCLEQQRHAERGDERVHPQRGDHQAVDQADHGATRRGPRARPAPPSAGSPSIVVGRHQARQRRDVRRPTGRASRHMMTRVWPIATNPSRLDRVSMSTLSPSVNRLPPCTPTSTPTTSTMPTRASVDDRGGGEAEPRRCGPAAGRPRRSSAGSRSPVA